MALMIPDDPKDVFDYGDRTIFQLRAQTFTIEGEYGTMIAPAPPPLPEVEVQEEPAAVEDPIARLEQKLDLALRRMDLLQQKIDSIDSTLARALNR
jgi:hypothetical protein